MKIKRPNKKERLAVENPSPNRGVRQCLCKKHRYEVIAETTSFIWKKGMLGEKVVIAQVLECIYCEKRRSKTVYK